MNLTIKLLNENDYLIKDLLTEKEYVAIHIINGKFSIYDYKHHDIISLFKWYPNNGYACAILKEEHLIKLPDILGVFELNKQIHMHLLIKVYILKEPKIINNKHDDFRTVFHHINGWCRDNRESNIMWIGRYEQVSILKTGKLNRSPYLDKELPKYVKWINAKKCYRIDEHPVIIKSSTPHKYIESKKGVRYSESEKYFDVIEKYNVLQNTGYYNYETYNLFLETIEKLKNENNEIMDIIKSRIKIMDSVPPLTLLGESQIKIMDPAPPLTLLALLGESTLTESQRKLAVRIYYQVSALWKDTNIRRFCITDYINACGACAASAACATEAVEDDEPDAILVNRVYNMIKVIELRICALSDVLHDTHVAHHEI